MKRYNDDPIFTSICATFIVIGIYLVALLKILVAFGFLSEFPVFSKTYLYNKLSWYPYLAVIFALVYFYFSRAKRKALIQEFNAAEDFYSGKVIVKFLIILAIPVVGFVYL